MKRTIKADGGSWQMSLDRRATLIRIAEASQSLRLPDEWGVWTSGNWPPRSAPISLKTQHWKKIALAVVVAGLIVIVPRFWAVNGWIEGFIDYIQAKGMWGALIFAGGYIAGTVLFLPGVLLTVGAGVAFGLFWGTVIASLSATVGAALAFLVARYLARGFIEQYALKNPRFKSLDAAIGEKGWMIVFLTRLSPLVPFNLSNYFYGVTRIAFWPYVVASFTGMLPGTVLYVYLGEIGKTALGLKGRRPPHEYLLLGIGLAATLAVTIYVTRLARRALASADSGS